MRMTIIDYGIDYAFGLTAALVVYPQLSLNRIYGAPTR